MIDMNGYEMGTIFVAVAVPLTVGVYIATIAYGVHQLEKSVESLKQTVNKVSKSRKATPQAKKKLSRVRSQRTERRST
jgi:hypothetical protein